MIEHIRINTVNAPYREIELRDNADFKRLPDTSFDAVSQNIKGTATVYPRARRRNLEIEIDHLHVDYYDVLEKIIGDRQEVYLESNIGEHTLVLAPFERARTNFLGGATGFSRASIATYEDDDGKIKEVASGIPRFENGKIGKGILLEPERTNRMIYSHPSSSQLIWSVDGGSPTINWDTNMPSNVDGHAGTVRINGNIGESVVKYVTVPNGVNMSACIWYKGCGSIILNLSGAAVGNTGSLTPNMNWQKMIIENLTTSSTSLQLTIGIIENNTTLWLSGHQVETDGKTITSYIPTDGAYLTRPQDQLYFTAGLNYIEGSIALWLRWPRLISNCTDRFLFYLNSNFYARIGYDGQIYWQVAAGIANNYTPSPLPNTGDMIHLAFVWKDEYAALIYNGVEVDSTTSTSRIAGSASIIQLYHTNNRCPHSVIDDFRFDNRYVEWRTSQSGEYDKWADDANMKLIKMTQGRRFRIIARNLEPRDPSPEYYDGSIILSESSSGADHTIEVA